MKTSFERDITTRVTIEATPDEFMLMLRWLYGPEFAEGRMGDGTIRLKPNENPAHYDHPYHRLVDALNEGAKGFSNGSG